jgi:hypothetical protein
MTICSTLDVCDGTVPGQDSKMKRWHALPSIMLFHAGALPKKQKKKKKKKKKNKVRKR